MSKFMLIIHDDIKGYNKYSRDELTALVNKMGQWSQQLRQAGVHCGAEKLTDDVGRTVTKNGIIDGPYTEAKELIGGYFIIEAENYDKAAAIAAECPALQAASRVEVREVADTCQAVVERAGH